MSALSASSSAPASTSAFFAVPATVTAGVPSTATIAAGTLRGSGHGDTSAVRALEVFLAVVGRDTTSLSNATSECYLTQSTPLCDIPGITVYGDRIQFADVHVPFTVPPSVDGSGRRFALRMQVLQADGSVYGGASSSTSSAPSSPAFVLANATGRSQLFSTVFAPGAYVPCGSLSCVDNCFSRLFGESTNLTSESASTAACANACAGIEGVDGVVAIPSDWLVVAASASSASVPLQVLSTVPAGTATGCFVSGTASASTSASAGTSKSRSQGACALWSLVVAGMLLACHS
ncbi:hypothetical protein SPBR_09047 [Sporothrix brasiliensis 5110]|uniref:Uncharacterized protein n=1 Tax=Sporothrix brasiliensis 5110 TaxID=1398154 RepID=A0A0C2IP55_9PEZI|nr:uncharacterized protein SPBR_09047 [Sporothrix brasiliensis 5110]KIH90811.1 hypothetical protein SPBR_09047 [Sporothrix brasiliensis 5110]